MSAATTRIPVIERKTITSAVGNANKICLLTADLPVKTEKWAFGWVAPVLCLHYTQKSATIAGHWLNIIDWLDDLNRYDLKIRALKKGYQWYIKIESGGRGPSLTSLQLTTLKTNILPATHAIQSITLIPDTGYTGIRTYRTPRISVPHRNSSQYVCFLQSSVFGYTGFLIYRRQKSKFSPNQSDIRAIDCKSSTHQVVLYIRWTFFSLKKRRILKEHAQISTL